MRSLDRAYGLATHEIAAAVGSTGLVRRRHYRSTQRESGLLLHSDIRSEGPAAFRLQASLIRAAQRTDCINAKGIRQRRVEKCLQLLIDCPQNISSKKRLRRPFLHPNNTKPNSEASGPATPNLGEEDSFHECIEPLVQKARAGEYPPDRRCRGIKPS